jgi:hypothetical protein
MRRYSQLLLDLPGKLLPYSFSLTLDSLYAVHHNDRPINDSRRSLDLHRKVNMTGRVDDVDCVSGPLNGN